MMPPSKGGKAGTLTRGGNGPTDGRPLVAARLVIKALGVIALTGGTTTSARHAEGGGACCSKSTTAGGRKQQQIVDTKRVHRLGSALLEEGVVCGGCVCAGRLSSSERRKLHQPVCHATESVKASIVAAIIQLNH